MHWPKQHHNGVQTGVDNMSTSPIWLLEGNPVQDLSLSHCPLEMTQSEASVLTLLYASLGPGKRQRGEPKQS